MALRDLQIRALRPADKIYQCPDERGLYLEVHPNGSKLASAIQRSMSDSYQPVQCLLILVWDGKVPSAILR